MGQDPPSADRPSLASRVRDTLIRSRRAAAEVAATEEAVAAVEDDVAATYDQAAQRSGPQSEHFQQLAALARDRAQAARQVAERERLAAGDQEDLNDI